MEKKIHKVLALKYRPKNFKELIGQDIMVETITNSIKLNKLYSNNSLVLDVVSFVNSDSSRRICQPRTEIIE